MTMYIVAYSDGSSEDWREYLVFVTQDKDKAEKYIESANNILEKWRSFYLEKSIEEQEGDYENLVFTERSCKLQDINSFYIMEIESR